MSTYFATLSDLKPARTLLEELVRSGVRPDDVSLVTKQTLADVRPEDTSVADASFFVGGSDDPRVDEAVPEGNYLTELTTTVESRLGAGIDTSEIATDVDTVDQSDDSQALSEDMLEPPLMISQSEHEADDLGLTMLTGFPTTVPLLDDVKDTEGTRQEQFAQGLETLSIPGFGTIMGGGPLATAGLDMIKDESGAEGFRTYLRDEGLTPEQIDEYCSVIDRGDVLISVMVTPGTIRESSVEEIAERWNVQSGALIDAPRFHEGGGYLG
jgi:hypothetical protein